MKRNRADSPKKPEESHPYGTRSAKREETQETYGLRPRPKSTVSMFDRPGDMKDFTSDDEPVNLQASKAEKQPAPTHNTAKTVKKGKECASPTRNVP